MRSSRRTSAAWFPALVVIGLAVVPSGCGVGGGNAETKASPDGLTPREERIRNQMAENEAAQRKAGSNAPR